ncbi:MAG: LPP20 family lipoprotein [Oceanospirillaceae bacterium]|nr:LPP20 family lipoprotein [Oceanospirillaceae bacterium]MCP5335798.1 LPP20 family lipoprotein [Oceanospirillaceae bacterium]MCP5349899.1 LPP20 family lipoprotein [Oceanospirillaceae bacterium]
MRKPIQTLLSIAIASQLLGCSLFGGNKDNDNVTDTENPATMLQPVEQKVDPIAPMVLRVVGYGAVNDNVKSMSKTQKRLMAIRASKLDAYRTMAERVYGTKISGSSTVRDMVVQNDSFRAYVDTFIHGARVVSSDVFADGSVETVLEMVIDAGFRNCISTENNMRFNTDCSVSVVHDMKGYRSNQMDNYNRVQSQSTIPETNHYFVQ